jgi:PKHD-type hydroxylase
MYKKLTNNPTERTFSTYSWVYWDNLFNEEELQQICEYFEQYEVQPATIMDDKNPINQEIRRSKIKFFHRDENNYTLFERLNSVIEDINDKYYNFVLNGYDQIQYTEYDASERGEYKFHMDTCFGKKENIDPYMLETRKLSLIMCLNQPGVDFEGGGFYINQGSEKDASEVEMKKGRIILFPSFLIHRVAPVTKGKRKSLVVWVMGPKFR